MSRYFWDMLAILSAVVWVIALVLQGYISPSFGAFTLTAIVFFTALGRSVAGNISRLIRFLFRIGLPLASSLTLAVILGSGDFRDIVGILSWLGVLCLALAGLYIMLLGFFSIFHPR